MTALAARSGPTVPAWAWDMILVSLFMVGAVLVLAIIVALVKRWRQGEDKPLSADAQLSHFRSLYEQGEISAEEFQALRAHLLGLPRQQPTKVSNNVPNQVPNQVPIPSAPAAEGVRKDLPANGTAPPEQPSSPPQPSPPPSDNVPPP